MKVHQGDFAMEQRDYATTLERSRNWDMGFTYECVQFPPTHHLRMVKENIGKFPSNATIMKGVDPEVVKNMVKSFEEILVAAEDGFAYDTKVSFTANGSGHVKGMASTFKFSSRKLDR